MTSSKYKLYGTINLCEGLIPNHIKPVFIDQVNRLYIGDTKDSLTIKIFNELGDGLKSSVKPLETTDNIIIEDIDKNIFRVGDLDVAGVEYPENRILLGRIDQYIEYISKLSKHIEYNEELSNMFKFEQDEYQKMKSKCKSIS